MRNRLRAAQSCSGGCVPDRICGRRSALATKSVAKTSKVAGEWLDDMGGSFVRFLFTAVANRLPVLADYRFLPMNRNMRHSFPFMERER